MATISLQLGVIDSPPVYQAVPNTYANLDALKRAFGGNENPKLGDYYAGGSFITNPPPTSSFQTTPIPASGPIKLGAFLGTRQVYNGTFSYPALTVPGWWWCATPELPLGWSNPIMEARIIGAGGGGGGGWGSGTPNANPTAGGGGGGGATDTTINTTEIGMSSYFEAYVPPSTPPGAGSSAWNGNAGNSYALGGNNGESAEVRFYHRTDVARLVRHLSSGGFGGTGGNGNAAYSDSPVPGGAIGGQPGSAGRGGSRGGGNGGATAFGGAGPGGYADTPGGHGTNFGAGGGGGGCRYVNNGYVYGVGGGWGFSGYVKVTLKRG